jgi:drug/metabolite transporter (DMT)-like permease
MEKNKQSTAGFLALAAAASIWGGLYVVSKVALDYIPPFTLLWIRYVIAFLCLWIMVALQGLRQPITRDWRTFATIGFAGYFLSIGLQFIGTWLSSAHMGALLTSTSPAFIVLFAYLMLGEKLTMRKLASVACATCGVIIVVGWEGSGFSVKTVAGDLALIGAAVSWALLSVLARKASASYPPLVITTYGIFWGCLLTTPAMLIEWQFLPVTGLDRPSLWLAILYISIVSTAGAFYLWNKGMQLVEAGAGSVFFFFQPIVGALLGWLLLDEQLGLPFFIGGGMILLSILAVSLPASAKNRAVRLKKGGSA